MDLIEITPHVVPLLTAIVAAAAAMGGASLTRRTQREASKVQILDITVQHLSDRVEALEKSVRCRVPTRRGRGVRAGGPCCEVDSHRLRGAPAPVGSSSDG